jgi:hypothetical protein
MLPSREGIMKKLRVLASGLVMLAWATPALAAAPPIGAWVSARGAQLVVTDHAACAFVVPTARAEGECIWRESQAGGILTIVYQGTSAAGVPQQQLLYLDIIWINQTTITVTGEPFRRTRW